MTQLLIDFLEKCWLKFITRDPGVSIGMQNLQELHIKVIIGVTNYLPVCMQLISKAYWPASVAPDRR